MKVHNSVVDRDVNEKQKEIDIRKSKQKEFFDQIITQIKSNADRREVSKVAKKLPQSTGLTTEDVDGEAVVLRRKHNQQAAIIRECLSNQ